MISIFAKEAFLNINPSEPLRLRKKPITAGHVMRVSSMIRGDQIAEKIGAKLNPITDFDSDVCIYVKPMVRKGDTFDFEGRKSYLDIIDGYNLVNVLWDNPQVYCITCSVVDYQTIKDIVKNKVVYIPQHHCNFDRYKRERKGIKRIGIIGTRDAFQFTPKELRPELEKRGIELVEYSKFFSRQDIIDFYMSIDLQFVWRPYKKILSNPLKLVNAASFGIPTIALYEKAFEEMNGSYIPVFSFDEVLPRLDYLIKDENLYKEYSDQGLLISEGYHIDNVAKLYKELDQ
jgi:hypothetical protein